jgi:HK97 family phage prohead protease
MYFKDFQAKQTTQDKPIKFVASTANPDRYGDVVDQKGWDLRAYNRNPVVLFNHNPAQMPIGKGKAYVENEQLMLEVEFDQKDDMAKTIEQKVRDGFINAVSVGFQPSKTIARASLPADHPYHGKSGSYFQASELLEVSIVTIPANNEATLSKQFSREIGLADVARSLIINKHIISVQELDNGNYLVEFAGHSPEDMEREEDAMKEEESEEERGHHDEDDKKEDAYHDEDDKDASYHDEDSEDEKDKMKDEDEDEEKYMSLDDFLRELRQFNN